MGYKTVCLNCNKVFSLGTELKNIRESNCTQCGKRMTLINQKFKAPKSESKEWEAIKFLVAHGFKYQRIYSMKEDGGLYPIDYPKNIKDAKEFVVKYKDQALKE